MSSTFTDGGIATAVPTVATCASPAFFSRRPTRDGVPVALKVKVTVGDNEATSVCAPASPPRVQAPIVATPFALLVAVGKLTPPLFGPGVNVTTTSDSASPAAFWTITAGRVATSVP